jgi:Cu(I)/Ag(I) efflux system membrane fusion protein
MKKTVLTMVAVAAMSLSAQAKTVKTVFHVGGACTEMCKPRIEKAAKQVPGVVSAKWNQKTQKLSLIYDNVKTNPQKVQKAIAAVGHDAGNIKASDATYGKLPGCCKYRK